MSLLNQPPNDHSHSCFARAASEARSNITNTMSSYPPLASAHATELQRAFLDRRRTLLFCEFAEDDVIAGGLGRSISNAAVAAATDACMGVCNQLENTTDGTVAAVVDSYKHMLARLREGAAKGARYKHWPVLIDVSESAGAGGAADGGGNAILGRSHQRRAACEVCGMAEQG